MKIHSLICTCILLITGNLLSSAQEQNPPAVVDAASALRLSTVLSSVNQERAELLILPEIVEGRTLPLLMLNHSSLASSDGQYLAQKPSELQTYYDLGLTYQYLESPLLRKQLQLSAEEGILVQSVKRNAAGYNAGFREGDLVLRVQDVPVDTQYDLVIAVDQARGQETKTRIRRGGAVQDFSFHLALPKAASKKRWIVGVSVETMSDILRAQLQVEGIVITSLVEDGPAKKMGLQVHDVITTIDDQQVSNLDDLRSIVQKSNGEEVRLNLIRQGNEMTVSLKPMEKEERNDFQFQSTFLPLQRGVYAPMYAHNQNLNLNIDGKSSTVSKLDKILKQLASIRRQVEKLKSTDK